MKYLFSSLKQVCIQNSVSDRNGFLLFRRDPLMKFVFAMWQSRFPSIKHSYKSYWNGQISFRLPFISTLSSQFIFVRGARRRRLGSGLGHASKDINKNISRNNRSCFGNGVIWRTDLDNIGANQVDALDSLKKCFELSGGPSSGLWCASGRGNAWIQNYISKVVISLAISKYILKYLYVWRLKIWRVTYHQCQ